MNCEQNGEHLWISHRDDIVCTHCGITRREWLIIRGTDIRDLYQPDTLEEINDGQAH